MGDTVQLSDVIHVLKASGVIIVPVGASTRRYILSMSEGYPEEHTFTDPVGKRDLQYLARKYNVYIHLFWNPEKVVIAPENDTLQ